MANIIPYWIIIYDVSSVILFILKGVNCKFKTILLLLNSMIYGQHTLSGYIKWSDKGSLVDNIWLG